MNKTKKVHIFHISEFGGHSKAAQNIKEAFLYKNPSIEVNNLNSFGYFYPRSEKVVDFLYTNTIKHMPSLWGKIYDKKKVAGTIDPYRKLVNKFAFKRLDEFIKERGADCFVTTQAFPNGLIADYKKKTGKNIPLVAIVTDYHPNRFWVHPCVDRYVVACKEAKDVLASEGIDEERIKILGIPVSLKFLATYPRGQICKDLGFQQNLNTVLIMGGGLGLGPIKVIAKELDSLDCNFQIIVVCGKNKNLYEWFHKKKVKFKKPLFFFSYVENINKIMDFSDIIITKAGGVTISESLAKGLCIIVTNPIPGQEERNVEYLLKRNAIIKADEVEEISNSVKDLFYDKKKMFFLREMANDNSFIDSSLRIVDVIEELMD